MPSMDVSVAETPSAAQQPRRRLRAWLSKRAIQAFVAILLLVGGGVFLTQLVQEVVAAPSTAGHHDFLAFHAAAQLVADGHAATLYDAASITALERQVISSPVGAAGYMPYINPPVGAVLQVPLGLLSEPAARLIWLLINLPLAALCCWLATAGLERRVQLLAAACLMSTFPFFQALVEGQWSLVMLAGCLGALWAARTNRPGWAGAGLAVLALKPPLLVPVLLVLLLRRAWRPLLTCIVVLLAAFLVTLPITGWSTQVDYAGYLVAVVGSHLSGAGAAGAAVWHGGIGGMEGLNGLAAGYVGQQNVIALDAITVVAAAAVIGRWALVARRHGVNLNTTRGRWVVISGIIAALLTDLHLYPQDCVLALLALPLLTAAVQPAMRLPLVLGVAAFLDAAWLDQLAFTPHLFTWVLLMAFIWTSARATGVEMPWASALASLQRRLAGRAVRDLPA